MSKYLILAFQLLFFMTKNIAAENKLPAWLSDAVFYQIYPQSFNDTNNDGIGDLNGITQKLDYLKKLGISAIWLNPVFESPFMDAGYDVKDYYRLAPRYGTEKELKKLLVEAHKRDIKVVLDLVAGHTSDQHKWFKKSQSKRKNKYSDFYIWTDDKSIKPEGYVSGDFPRNGNYLKNFFDCQPALNFGVARKKQPWEQTMDASGPRKVKEELVKIIDFWMKKGVNGFRVDMASSLIKNDTDFRETTKLWNEIRNRFSAIYPEGVLIAEWSNPKQAINAGFMIDFMMHFNVPGYPSMFFNDGGVFVKENCYFDSKGNGSPMEFISNYTEQIKAVGNNGFVSIPSANHDINRLNSGNRNTVEQLKVAMAFLLTLKGIPFIYYGDELGMRYIPGLLDKEGSVLTNLGNVNRAGSRTPMQWNKGKNAGFSNADKAKLYLPVDSLALAPTVDEQLDKPGSLLEHVRQLIRLRREYPSLGNNGSIEFFNNENTKYPLCYIRKSGFEKSLVVLNPTNKLQKVEIDLAIGDNFSELLQNSSTFTIKGSKAIVELSPTGYAIYISKYNPVDSAEKMLNNKVKITSTNSLKNTPTVYQLKPSLNVESQSGYALVMPTYKPSDLADAVELLLKADDQTKMSENYRSDLVLFTRQALANLALTAHKRMAEAVKSNNVRKFVKHAADFMEIAEDIDVLSGSDFSHTHLPAWQKYIELVKQSLLTGKTVDKNTVENQKIEFESANDFDTKLKPEIKLKSNTIETATLLFEKYKFHLISNFFAL